MHRRAGLRHARAFASRRRAESGQPRNRLYAVESTPTNSGSRADHRLPLKASEIESFARALAAQLNVAGAAAGPLSQAATAWVAPLVADLQAAQGRSLVIAGDGAPASVHALVHAINAALGNVGQTVTYTQTAEARPSNQLADLRELVGDMNAGTVDFLLILGGNPVYTAPADLKFGAALQKVALRAHVGQYEDETAELCQWHVPEAHFLEMWSDVRSDDGTVTIVQPLIAPLYGGKSPHEVLAAFDEGGEAPRLRHRARALGQADGPFHGGARCCRGARSAARSGSHSGARLRRLPRCAAAGAPAATPALPALAPIAAAQMPALSPFDREWRRWLHDGLVPDTAFAPKQVTPQAAPAAAAAAGRVGPRSRVPARPRGLRRPLREQRLAAGAAEVADQAHVGQRRADRARHGRAPRADQRRHRDAEARRPDGAHPGVARARTGARHADAASRLRPHARRPHGHRHRVQRQRAAHDRRRPTRSAACSWRRRATATSWPPRRTTGRSRAAT